MNQKNTGLNMKGFAAIGKLILIFLLLTYFIGSIQDNMVEKVDKYYAAIELVFHDDYNMVIDGVAIDKTTFDTSAPNLEYVYKVVEINDETKTVYLVKRKY